MAIGLKPEQVDAYCEAHRAVPEDVLRTVRACGIRNYSIYLRNAVLFSYFEYVGADFAADMAKMAADPATQQWWKEVGPMQEPYSDRDPGEWWTNMIEVFHLD